MKWIQKRRKTKMDWMNWKNENLLSNSIVKNKRKKKYIFELLQSTYVHGITFPFSLSAIMANKKGKINILQIMQMKT